MRGQRVFIDGNPGKLGRAAPDIGARKTKIGCAATAGNESWQPPGRGSPHAYPRAGGLLAGLAAARLAGVLAGLEPNRRGTAARDSAGVVIVENPVRGLWQAEERWRVEEDLRIGAVAGAAAGAGGTDR